MGRNSRGLWGGRQGVTMGLCWRYATSQRSWRPGYLRVGAEPPRHGVAVRRAGGFLMARAGCSPAALFSVRACLRWLRAEPALRAWRFERGVGLTWLTQKRSPALKRLQR